MKNNKKVFILILVILLLTSCDSSQSTTNNPDNTTDEPNLNSTENNSLESTVQEYEDKISQLESQLAEFKKENEELREENTLLQDESTKTEELIMEEGNKQYSNYKARLDDIILHIPDEMKLINMDGQIIKDRFNLPEGFERVIPEEGSFGAYIQNLPLKEHAVLPKLYTGDQYLNEEPEYVTVVDIPLDNKDLEQSSDSAIRLNAEYLFKTEQYNDISYPFANGFTAEYSKWMEGNRLVTKDNQLEWAQKTDPSNTYEDLKKYLDIVYSYSNTDALNHYLEPVDIKDIQIGDMFVKKACIGRCVMVADMAINESTNEKIVLLAMSDNFTTSEIGIIRNLYDRGLVCWFRIPSENGETQYIDIPGDSLSLKWLRRF
ncbi:DUF4846 domain-containing protein [Vallitalea guaymasensis]|uniref:DUF4846 domain-containing protein n=1 Tax=Vallitalea guaymasensis TaxID=1185412 RepID=UPI00272D4027|nr:DUF4846 domain-containing protein [Vallitalea guaymasensis]